jgi:hypothetical protein
MIELIAFCFIAAIGLKFFGWVVDTATNFIAGSAKFIAWAFVGALVWTILTGTELNGTVEMMIENVKSML